MFQLPGMTASPSIVNQAVDFAVAQALIPKDPAVEALKKDMVKDRAVARIETYQSIIETLNSTWASQSKAILKRVNNDVDHQEYTDALERHNDDVQSWVDCIKAEQSKLTR